MIAERYAAAAEGDGDLHVATVKLEKALLGAVLMLGMLPKQPPRPEEFVLDAHRVTWTAVLAIAARGEAPEGLPVSWELVKMNQLERAGGFAYLASHLDSTDCSDIQTYARLVKEAARMREFMRRAET